MRELAKKAFYSLKNEGMRTTVRKGKNYIKDRTINRGKNTKDFHRYVDVLFINGCTLPHPSRYRVVHQMEQLLMANITSENVYYEDLDLLRVNYARVFVFFRCPYTETIGTFIEKAKRYNKTVIFDIDDLVFNTQYTDTIPYIIKMDVADRKIYDDGVVRMGKTLSLCDAAITTTEVLAEELSKYVKKVYINRNVASDSMLAYSNAALESLQAECGKANRKKDKCIIKIPNEISLGYFSGSITHNTDFAIILPVIQRLMAEKENLHLYLVGELDLPDELKRFEERIHTLGFMDWQKLPFVIAQMDINLAPLEDTLFNRAKSENKWTEASLVKVLTVASDVGAFHTMIEDQVTGVLCRNTEEDWYQKLCEMIDDSKKRKCIACRAYDHVLNHCLTMETCYQYAQMMHKLMCPNIMFKIPNAQISGGILVAEKHATYLQEKGLDVSFIHDGEEEIECFQYGNYRFPLLRSRTTAFMGSMDSAVATLYTTMEFVQNYPNIKNRLYFVQNLETNFPFPGNWDRIRASQSYMPIGDVRFITISRWCEKWLKEKYGVATKYAPNGIDCKLFYPEERDFSGKIRILIEGNSVDHNKNVDESFKIIDMLDSDKFEVWYISYQGKPKEWYRVDRFFRRVPNHKMPDIYRQCHILLKTSILESFSYPPLEMMATGGFVVARANEGNIEYLKDEYNCLFFDPEKLETAVKAIGRLLDEPELRTMLRANGVETANARSWEKLKQDILALYE